jgi:hypothetical protein
MKILFVRTADSSFILRDRDILRSIGDLTDIEWTSLRDAARVVCGVLRSTCVVLHGARGKNGIVATASARLLRRRMVAIVQGSEVSRNPESGNLGGFRGGIGRLICRLADVVVCPSELTRKELGGRGVVIYNCVDPKKFFPSGEERAFVTTVVSSEFRRKGVDRILKLKEAGTDVKVMGLNRVPEDELIAVYRKTRFYLQLSRYESFGLAVMEAQACGATPIISKGLGCEPLVHGYIVDGDDLTEVSRIIREERAIGDAYLPAQMLPEARRGAFAKVLGA